MLLLFLLFYPLITHNTHCLYGIFFCVAETLVNTFNRLVFQACFRILSVCVNHFPCILQSRTSFQKWIHIHLQYVNLLLSRSTSISAPRFQEDSWIFLHLLDNTGLVFLLTLHDPVIKTVPCLSFNFSNPWFNLKV